MLYYDARRVKYKMFHRKSKGILYVSCGKMEDQDQLIHDCRKIRVVNVQKVIEVPRCGIKSLDVVYRVEKSYVDKLVARNPLHFNLHAVHINDKVLHAVHINDL